MKRKIKNIYYSITKIGINVWYGIKFKLFRNNWRLNNSEDNTNRIIVSVTSFPARIDRIHYSLKSILSQRMKPDKIVVYLGKKEFQNVTLPKSLTELFQYGVEVRFCEDLKPHTKYFYAMQEFPEDIIITVDDDIYYRPNLIIDLFKYYKKYPLCVICTRAHKMTFSNNKLDSYSAWDFETADVNHPSHYLMATGVGGVLYPPHLLCSETFNSVNIKELSLKQDDVWLKFMEILSGVKVCAIPSNKVKYVVGVIGSEKITLNSTNVHQNMNDEFIKNVIEYYNISSFDFNKE